jgi:predicted RND superfamily exporter protein
VLPLTTGESVLVRYASRNLSKIYVSERAACRLMVALLDLADRANVGVELAGVLARCVADAVGFAVLLVIDVQTIRELAIAASIRVAVLIFTNLILCRSWLSYTGVSAKAAARSLRAEAAGAGQPLWQWLDRFTQRRWATVAVVASGLLAVGGVAVAERLKIGDLDPGAPELRANSRYNRDVSFMNVAYGASSDVLAVMVKTPDGQCSQYDTLNKIDALECCCARCAAIEAAIVNRASLMVPLDR